MTGSKVAATSVASSSFTNHTENQKVCCVTRFLSIVEIFITLFCISDILKQPHENVIRSFPYKF
jgi:hypothetical protein